MLVKDKISQKKKVLIHLPNNPGGKFNYFEAIKEFSPSFEPYLADLIVKGGGGADINKLEDQGTILIGFMPDSQRYFDLHHSENDVFENVNKRELHLGAATMASLFYLIDQKGLPEKIKD